jgi:hypothetical protein
MLADEMVTVDRPAFVNCAESALDGPTITLPNQRFPDLQLKAPVLVYKNSGGIETPVPAFAGLAANKKTRIAELIATD